MDIRVEWVWNVVGLTASIVSKGNEICTDLLRFASPACITGVHQRGSYVHMNVWVSQSQIQAARSFDTLLWRAAFMKDDYLYLDGHFFATNESDSNV